MEMVAVRVNEGCVMTAVSRHQCQSKKTSGSAKSLLALQLTLPGCKSKRVIISVQRVDVVSSEGQRKRYSRLTHDRGRKDQ